MNQWGRKIGLLVLSDTEAVDLSEFRITFGTRNADQEQPNSAKIRVYNLANTTVQRIRGTGEFSRVVLQAGYAGGNYGVIFQGTIKQFRVGRVNQTDSYLDLLAADGDLGYSQGVVNTALTAGATREEATRAITSAMPGVSLDTVNQDNILYDRQHVPNIRGQVLFGMARSRLRSLATSSDFTWSIQNGVVTRVPRTGYLPGEAAEINVNTGMVGMPEETDGGVRVTTLLNSNIRIGGLVKLNNEDIIQLLQRDPNAAPIAYNQWAGWQYNAPLSKGGYYRVFVAEHEGDTRGHSWYTHMTCLAVDISAGQKNAVNPS